LQQKYVGEVLPREVERLSKLVGEPVRGTVGLEPVGTNAGLRRGYIVGVDAGGGGAALLAQEARWRRC